MTARKTPLERAFETARTGAYDNIEDLRRQLSREGLDQRQVAGPVLNRQLMDAPRKARDDAKGS